MDVTATYATTPFGPKYAGNGQRNASTAIAIAAMYGTRSPFSRRHSFHPGTAWSRENAYIIREADVIDDMPQKNCAPTQMKSRNSAPRVPRESRKTCLTANPPAAVVAFSLWIAKVTPSARM